MYDDGRTFDSRNGFHAGGIGENQVKPMQARIARVQAVPSGASGMPIPNRIPRQRAAVSIPRARGRRWMCGWVRLRNSRMAARFHPHGAGCAGSRWWGGCVGTAGALIAVRFSQKQVARP